jgi:hypothetical protein
MTCRQCRRNWPADFCPSTRTACPCGVESADVKTRSNQSYMHFQCRIDLDSNLHGASLFNMVGSSQQVHLHCLMINPRQGEDWQDDPVTGLAGTHGRY